VLGTTRVGTAKHACGSRVGTSNNSQAWMQA
jgi:hypothetical protein